MSGDAATDRLREALAGALRQAAHVCQHNPCTSCLIVSDEEFDATVMGTAVHAGVVTSVEGPITAVADVLLPVVEAECRRRAAEELRAMAAVFRADARNLEGGQAYAHAAEDCDTRADAIEGRP